jgi:hypothetical protein
MSTLLPAIALPFDALWNVQISSANADASAPELISIKTSPNPFSQNLEISCSLKESAPIKLEVFNLKGQKVKTLYEGIQNPGTWNITWDGRDITQRTAPPRTYLVLKNIRAQGTAKLPQNQQVLSVIFNKKYVKNHKTKLTKRPHLIPITSIVTIKEAQNGAATSAKTTMENHFQQLVFQSCGNSSGQGRSLVLACR